MISVTALDVRTGRVIDIRPHALMVGRRLRAIKVECSTYDLEDTKFLAWVALLACRRDPPNDSIIIEVR